MRITVMTLFKETINTLFDYSIMGRARKSGLVELEAVDIRDFANNKHHQVDDYPYGGGAGMLMMAQPVYDCYEHIRSKAEGKSMRILYMTPHGKVWNQQLAEEFSKEENIVILCGHYEGIDQRVIDEIVTDEISIGDFVLTGGELPAVMIADSIIRLLPGVLGKQESFEEESFSDGLLEYYHYTRPAVFRGKEVPPVLLSGNHQKIAEHRRQESLINTYKKRPELLETAKLTHKERTFIEAYAKKVCNENQDML
ncbi:tRNA (guanosine(37)-N1)-methyltransferase TrmD [Cellulosilyticum lentocellum]|uniref:tRNA (guanine-N(1)-)-methyltransferase n=1 Tax=Cellulosilyticum lentocellum (strain ATCC 49066 / DSM 5427 / NCIMB 11756 / RHM5) TaxID=642492 RepID=F2JS73_CELLD|nr:tRNA (guanine-N(1)-)-methyltransferase [Cellulosilyticum lentocellum DSM 5427]